ncbi:family 43 glycosylhydrolase [Micromonospora sp. M12]
MKSYDLVNWEIVNYVFDRASIGDSFSLRNGQNSYGQGQWASSLRFHDGTFYAVFNTNNLSGAYLYRTDDIENGPWQLTPSAVACTTRRSSSTSTARPTSSTAPAAPAPYASTPT